MDATKRIVTDVLERVHPNEYEIIKSAREVSNINKLEHFIRLSKKGGTFSVLIHYPEITITNSMEHKHKIQDLFIILNFRNGIMHGNIRGFRTTYSFKEFSIGYKHSHLSQTLDINGIRNFCLGDSILNTLTYNIRNATRNGDLTEYDCEACPEYLSIQNSGLQTRASKP